MPAARPSTASPSSTARSAATARTLLTDAIEFGRQSLKARSLKDIVDLNVAFMTRRSQAMFASVNELNAIAQAKTVAAWSPLGETLRKAGEKVVGAGLGLTSNR